MRELVVWRWAEDRVGREMWERVWREERRWRKEGEKANTGPALTHVGLEATAAAAPATRGEGRKGPARAFLSLSSPLAWGGGR